MKNPYSANTKQILYVDDEPQALKYFSLLYGKQFEIATAISADDGLAYINAHPNQVGVLVTDQRMPGKTGVELMEQVRFRHPNIVRVLVTAYSELNAAIQAVNEGGAFRYLTKPINESEMIGTLLRALEHHLALSARDQLLAEKLSVLHRLIVMDRIRGLATAATALDGRINNAWPALVDYMQQSPVRQRIRIQMAEISEMNMIAVARREAEFMVRTVEMLLDDTVHASTGSIEPFRFSDVIAKFVQDTKKEFQENDIEFEVVDSTVDVSIQTDSGMLKRLFNIVVRRIADMLDQPTRIELRVRNDNAQSIVFELIGAFGGMTSCQFASLFSAAIPLQKWPIGLDMDLLSAFMITHHLGGTITILPSPPDGPGIRIVLPLLPPNAKSRNFKPNWFDTVYDSLEEWENDIAADMAG